MVNRQTKRMMQRQGQVEADGSAAVRKPPVRNPRQPSERTTPAEFAREVRSEMRQVAWPKSPEVVNYASVVLVALVLLTGLIFVLNYAFSKAMLFMFKP
ncbi:MAG: preprotein translocase subunit SecE [Acidimicrobiales bacterium]